MKDEQIKMALLHLTEAVIEQQEKGQLCPEAMNCLKGLKDYLEREKLKELRKFLEEKE